MSLEAIKVDFAVNFIDFSIKTIREILHKDKKVVFISPNRRPLRFIKMQLEEDEIFDVDFYTINDFIDRICSVYRPNLKKDSKVKRELFFLKLIRDKVKTEEHKAFVWAKRLSNLFNDFDKQLVEKVEDIKYTDLPADPKAIVEDLKELFDRYKREYRDRLFEGKASAVALNIVKDRKFLDDFDGYAFIFAGFGSMSKSEIKLVSSIADRFDLYLLVQTDLAKRDKIGDVSFENCWVVEKLLKELKVNKFREVRSENEDTQIEFYEFNSRHAETSFVANILNKAGYIKSPFKIGIVMPENDTILPFLSFIDSNVNLNITTTYPFKLTPFGGFLKSLFELLIDAQKRDFVSLNPYILLKLLNSSFSSYLKSLNLEHLLNYLYSNPSISVKTDKFASLKRIVDIFKDVCDFYSLKRAFLKLFDDLDKERLKDNILDLYSVNLFYSEIVENLPVDEKQIDVDIVFAYYFIKESIEDLEIPFEGHPLKGIQILGALESRMLGFDELFVLDTNEDVLPKSSKIDPLMPEELKKAFGLTTFYEKEKLIRYNFFRLIYSSKRVRILYRTSTTADEKSQKSRYVEQLMILNRLKGRMDKPKVYLPKLSNADVDVRIDKDALKDYIKAKLEGRGFSPSEINEFVKCPYAFYLHRVKGIEGGTSFGEKFEADKVGSIIHKILQKEFEKYQNTGEIITLDKYKAIKDSVLNGVKDIKSITEIIKKDKDTKDFAAYLENMEPIRKKAFLIVLRYRIENFFNKTSEKFEDFRVLFTEKEFKDSNLHLFGILDRVDEIGDKVRIVDYKSGYHSQGYKTTKIKETDFENIEECCNFITAVNDVYSSLQMPVYMIMVEKQFENREIIGEIYHLGGSASIVEKFKSEDIDIHRRVIEILMKKIEDCENPCAFPSEFCSFCEFNRFCPFV